MDEVQAMTRTGERVGKVVGIGIRTARHGACRAGHAGKTASKQAAARAEQELADRGVSTDELQDMLARKTTGLSRDELAKKSKQARKWWGKTAARSRAQWTKNALTARKELAARIDPTPATKRRKWPWVLLVMAALSAAAAVTLSRRPEELPIAEADLPPEARPIPNDRSRGEAGSGESDGES